MKPNKVYNDTYSYNYENGYTHNNLYIPKGAYDEILEAANILSNREKIRERNDKIDSLLDGE